MKEVRIQVATARKNFAKVLARAAKSGERIKVVRYRTTLAGIVPGRDLERLDECEDLVKEGKKKAPTKKTSRASARSARPTAAKKAASRRARPTARPSKKRTSSKAKQARK